MNCPTSGSSVHGIFPHKNAGVGCHSYFLTQGSNPRFLCLPYWQTDSLLLHHPRSPDLVNGVYVALLYPVPRTDIINQSQLFFQLNHSLLLDKAVWVNSQHPNDIAKKLKSIHHLCFNISSQEDSARYLGIIQKERVSSPVHISYFVPKCPGEYVL